MSELTIENNKTTCPECTTEMEAGSIKIHGSLGGFLLFGLSEQQLYFKRQGQKKEIRILEDHNTREGFRCPNCRTIVVKNVSSPME